MNRLLVDNCTKRIKEMTIARWYCVQWTNECGNDCELEFAALTDEGAIGRMQAAFRGCEGLDSGVLLTGHDGEVLEFSPF